MPALYELSDQYNELQTMLESGEYTEEELRDTIEMIGVEFDEKAINIVKIIRKQNDQLNSAKAEIKRVQNVKKYYENNVERLKKYLLDQMQAANKLRIQNALDKVSVVNAPEKIDENSPEWGEKGRNFVEWARTHNRDDLLNYAEPEPDKKAIKDALKDGQDIPATLIREKALRIG